MSARWPATWAGFSCTPCDDALRSDLLDRVEGAGYRTLVITADVPKGSRRERQRKAHIRVPPKITPRLMWQSVTHPAWSMAVLRHGIPRFRTIEQYLDGTSLIAVAGFVGASLGGSLSFDYVAEVRARGRATSSSRASSIQPMRDARSTSAPTPSGSRTMAAVSSKPRRRRSAACRRSPPRSAMRCRSCSTPVSVRGPTSPGRSASGPISSSPVDPSTSGSVHSVPTARARVRDPPRRPAERDAPDRLCPPGRAARTDPLTVVGPPRLRLCGWGCRPAGRIANRNGP